MAVRYQWLLLTLIACTLAVFTPPAYAQFGLPGSGSALFITFSPASPNPGDTVRLSLTSSLADISDDDILWQANGKQITRGKGVDTTSVKVGALGAETRINVSVTALDGETTSAQATLVPTSLDLLVDSDSYTPPFYRGRPLASAGTNLRLEALPHFLRGRATVPATELIYTWRRNNQILSDFSGRGKSAAVIPVEHLFGTETISVEARSADGLLSHTTSFTLAAAEPLLLLYQDHPLYGVMYHRALLPSAFISETEMTFAAVPLYAQARGSRDPLLNFAWRVNSTDVTANRTDPNKLTINAENSSGVAFVELETTRAENFYLDAKGVWNILFSTVNNATDQFHSTNQ